MHIHAMKEELALKLQASVFESSIVQNLYFLYSDNTK